MSILSVKTSHPKFSEVTLLLFKKQAQTRNAFFVSGFILNDWLPAEIFLKYEIVFHKCVE